MVFELGKVGQRKEILVPYADWLQTELRDQALSNYQALSNLAVSPAHGEPDLEDPQLSFQLAQALPDLDFLNALLRHRSEVGRLKQLNHYLTEFVPRQRTIKRMTELAPTNGFGGKPAGL